MFLFVSLLGIAVVLYGILKGKQETSDNSQDKELEASLHAFMDEFEKENQYLIDTIQQLQAELRQETAANRERIGQLETKIERLGQASGAQKTVEQPEATPAIVFNEHYSRVVMMSKEGRTPEQISKDTGIGMGEIQMILSLVKQGNAV
ncbi:DUF6115 domain-containing protein [Effusibacillus consociatus]|uniref:DUF6115 domain-containing protein n=1 Tax=Effusibacillus consociatus TaxID=1117041 RepID=A0ABV9Q3F3_9BACL